MVRYEDLHRDTAAEVARIASVIRPVDRAAIEQAVSARGVEEMRRMSGNMSKHVRTATVGASRQRLTPVHLAIFRERHGDLIQRLGYDAR